MEEIESLHHHFFLNEAGQPHGRYVTYHVFNKMRGAMSTECTFVNGVLSGEYKSYHMNGRVARHMYMHDDREHGDRKEYSESGKLTSHVFFINGDLIDSDANTITKREKFLMSLKHGVRWIKD